jgi:hypothetical protein
LLGRGKAREIIYTSAIQVCYAREEYRKGKGEGEGEGSYAATTSMDILLIVSKCATVRGGGDVRQ